MAIHLAWLEPAERVRVMKELARAYLDGVPATKFWQEHSRADPRLSRIVVQQLYRLCIAADAARSVTVLCRCGKPIGHRAGCRRSKEKKPVTPSLIRVIAEPIPTAPEHVATTCPCCFRATSHEKLFVNLDTNTVSYHGWLWRASPQLAVFIFKLADAWPKSVGSHDMRVAIWGPCDGPDKNDMVLKTYASHARRMFEATGIKIVVGGRSGSYAILMPDHGECHAHDSHRDLLDLEVDLRDDVVQSE